MCSVHHPRLKGTVGRSPATGIHGRTAGARQQFDVHVAAGRHHVLTTLMLRNQAEAMRRTMRNEAQGVSLASSGRTDGREVLEIRGDFPAGD